MTTLQSTALSKLTLRGMYNKLVAVRGSVRWPFIALRVPRTQANAPVHTSPYSNNYMNCTISVCNLKSVYNQSKCDTAILVNLPLFAFKQNSGLKCLVH